MSKKTIKTHPNHAAKFTLGADVLADVRSFSESVDARIVELRTELNAPEGATINPPVISSDEQRVLANHWELFFAQRVQSMMHEILGITPNQDTKCYSDTPDAVNTPNLGAESLEAGQPGSLDELLKALQGAAGDMGASDDGVNYEADQAAEG